VGTIHDQPDSAGVGRETAWISQDGIDDATLLVCVTDDEHALPAEPTIPADYLMASSLEVRGGRKYDVVRVVARGGMGVVYEAKDISCDRTVAIKILLSDEEHRDENRRRFVGEARITSRLEHPNIVPIHELGKDAGGNVFYSMKYVRGVTLGDILNDIRRGREETIRHYPLGRLLTVFQKICDAVAFAHANGVVHRDLKPGNVMIGNYGEVLVLDWGLARLLNREDGTPEPSATTAGDARPADAKITLQTPGPVPVFDTIRVDTAGAGLKTISGTVLGTPGFMAPEQVRKDGVVDERTDIYALGSILYSILTLNSPVREKRIPELLRVILAGEIIAPSAYNRWDTPGKLPNLPHCPGSEIPPVLSAITMKAMATAPENRFQTVKDFQQEIEDYQNGLVWHLVLDEDFSSPDALKHWEVIGGKCEIRDGELRFHGGELQMLLLKREMPTDVRIDFECHEEGTYLNDVGCILSGIHYPGNDWETSISGYAFKYGAYTNTLNVLTKCDKRMWSEAATSLAPGKRYHVRAERVGPRLRVVVNNREVVSFVDPEPLTGSNRTLIGLLGWIADTRYSRIRVYSLGTPWKSDILDIAERQLQKSRYVTAMDLFREVMESFPDTARMERAQKGYDTASARHDMITNLPKWQAQLAAAWPGVSFKLRIDSDGLTLEVPDAGIDDLAPVAGLPLTHLACWGNSIRDLGPLRGTPLAVLNCAGNPITSLEPLRGMALHSLRCEGCRITTLEPLSGMPLTFLNVSENPLEDGIEPLAGMKLTWLSCIHCGIETLEPLRGMPLTMLFCEANRFTSLEPLSGMPLTEMACSGNRIESLEPLTGLPLNTLRCSDTRVRSLEPLRGMPLSTFSIQANRVESLEPLRGMPLAALYCGGNRIKDLGPFIKNPPSTFLFECDALSTEELQFIFNTWSRDFRFAHHARNVEVLLALRRGDVKKLRELATPFGGHHYLFVPKYLTWAEARDACVKVHGHLASITSAEENEFVASMFPLGGSWYWIGLETVGGRHQWVSGEPFDYSAFISVLQSSASGPWVFSGKCWCYDLIPNAHNAFILEWDD